MIDAGGLPVGGVTKSLENPTVLRRSPAATFVTQCSKLHFQALQFRDAPFHVTDMGIQKRVDLTTVLVWRGAKFQQNPDLVQRHVEGAATANERQQFGVLLPIPSKVPACSAGFWQQPFMLVIPNRLDSASGSARKFAYCLSAAARNGAISGSERRRQRRRSRIPIGGDAVSTLQQLLNG
jgi:hypothetical protein